MTNTLPFGLHFHLATNPVCIGVTAGDTLICGSVEVAQHGFCEEITDRLSQHCAQAGITLQDLQYLTTTIGPGSYTNTRIGVTTAKSLAQVLEIPLFAFSTLAAMAWGFCQVDGIYFCALETRAPAMMGGLYRAFEGQIIPLCAEFLTDFTGMTTLLSRFKSPITIISPSVLPSFAVKHRTIHQGVALDGLRQAGWTYFQHHPGNGRFDKVFPIYAHPPVVGPKKGVPTHD